MEALNPKFVPVELRPARFQAPKPVFQPPSKGLINYNQKREVPVAKSLKELGQIPHVTTLIVEEKKSKPSKLKLDKKDNKPVAKSRYVPPFGPEDIVSDAEYIKLTRSFCHATIGEGTSMYEGVNLSDAKTLRLFFANGGAEKDSDGVMFVDKFDTLANAFDALRLDKLARLSGLKATEYKRYTQMDMRDKSVYSSHLEKQYSFVNKVRAREEAEVRSKSETWRDSGMMILRRTNNKKVA